MKLSCYLLTIFTCVFILSCKSYKDLTKNAIYFQNTTDSLLKGSATTYNSWIQNGDILYIGVITANDASSRLLNQQNFYGGTSTTPSAGNSGTGTVGYLVDQNGEIIFPYIGVVKAAGLSKTTLTDTITRRIRNYVSDAIVSIRVLNYKVTVLGEVTKPGSYSIPSERVSILDALGLAGDLTVFGRRDNVKIIREVNGQRSMGMLDLSKGDIFASPYYYLQQNDIVYVEMTDRKMRNTDQTNTRNFSLALGLITAVALVVTTISNF